VYVYIRANERTRSEAQPPGDVVWCVSLHERRETRLPAVLTVAAAAVAAVALSFSILSREIRREKINKAKMKVKQNQKRVGLD